MDWLAINNFGSCVTAELYFPSGAAKLGDMAGGAARARVGWMQVQIGW